jgi:hypothetical protein
MRGTVLHMAGIEIFSGLMSCGTVACQLREGNYSDIGNVSAWNEKCEQQHGREVAKLESRERFESEHRAKVQRYIADHPDLDEKKKSDIRGHCPVPGMTKEEVRLFLNDPVEVIRDPQELAKAAPLAKRGLEGRVDEA